MWESKRERCLLLDNQVRGYNWFTLPTSTKYIYIVSYSSLFKPAVIIGFNIKKRGFIFLWQAFNLICVMVFFEWALSPFFSSCIHSFIQISLWMRRYERVRTSPECNWNSIKFNFAIPHRFWSQSIKRL